MIASTGMIWVCTKGKSWILSHGCRWIPCILAQQGVFRAPLESCEMRMDSDNYVFQQQFGSALLSENNKWKEVDDWFSYAKTLPTIEGEMEHLIRPKDMAKTVYVIHMPPALLGLDKCSHGAEVGSKAIFKFIEKNQPLLTLHGHIHESPRMTEKWFSELGKTVFGAIAKSMQGLARQAEIQYSIEVEDIIKSQDRGPNRIQHLLDYMLGFCFDDRVLVLYKKLCRYYFFIDPEATAFHINSYREMWDEESLKPPLVHQCSPRGTPAV